MYARGDAGALLEAVQAANGSNLLKEMTPPYHTWGRSGEG